MKKIDFEVPYMLFPPSWRVQIIPADNADARFRVKDITNGNVVSVYLDSTASLGACNEPYWEVYRIEGTIRDAVRCLVSEGAEDLLKLIFIELNGEGRDE